MQTLPCAGRIQVGEGESLVVEVVEMASAEAQGNDEWGEQERGAAMKSYLRRHLAHDHGPL